VPLLALLLSLIAPLPAPNARIPRDPAALAAALTTTIRDLRATTWTGEGKTPEDVTYLALYHERMLRRMAARRALGDAALKRLPDDVRGESRDTVRARRALDAIPRGRPPRIRVAAAAPAAELRRDYAAAQRATGIPWTVLAAINFVESDFGRVRSASEAGARGPMQFMPATWRAYGRGDIDDPHDAILAAARYLRANGGRARLDRALYAYNHSSSYVRAVKAFAHRMPTTFLTYYAWQVYVRTPTGTRRVTGPKSSHRAA
jgi:membrane-bound lytic murein transglycosylase B